MKFKVVVEVDCESQEEATLFVASLFDLATFHLNDGRRKGAKSRGEVFEPVEHPFKPSILHNGSSA